MTLLEHVRFSFQVQLGTDCHMGDGNVAPIKSLRLNLNVDEVKASTVARDHAGRPCVPSTSLKGALKKAVAGFLTTNDIDNLFGSIKEGDGGAMGKFAFYPGVWDEKQKVDGTELPYFDEKAGTWIATHVAISRQTGTAEAKKLYNEEMLPAGTVFRISGTWFGSLDDTKSGLADILAPLASEEGLNIGSGSKLGLGALRFLEKDQVVLNHTYFDLLSANVVTKASAAVLTISAKKAVSTPVVLKLACPGPFASVDPVHKHGVNDGNKIRALKRYNNMPVLHLHSIMGALRSRTAWVATINGLGGDDRFGKPVSWESPLDLSPVERLFGVAGWRGILRISVKGAVTATGRQDMTSIAIDKFTGAVLDSALFTREVFTGVELAVNLTLETRTSAPDKDKETISVPTQEDRELLKLLLDDLNGDVLMLGHATNSGFGWFNVKAENIEGVL